MKIEICEQMLQSWLMNCKLCEVVQTNWMISPLRDIDSTDIKNVENLMKDIQDKLNATLDTELKTALQESADNDSSEEYLIESDEIVQNQKKKKRKKVQKLNIIKKSTANQFIRQCEIDVVGTKFNDGVAERIFLVDTAFHKGGLGYHDAVATVLKKIIRAILVSTIIFGTHVPVSVIFAAPKCGPTLKKQIEDVVDSLRTVIAKDYPDTIIELYMNENFTENVYKPLKEKIDSLNNDNDLFMRALNLAKVAEENKDLTVSESKKILTKTSTITSSSKTPKNTNQKIVFDILDDLCKTGKISMVLNDLRMPPYARVNFKMSTYPVLLKELDFVYSGFESCRFYKNSINIKGDKYLVCNQWIPERIALLQDWYKNL